MDPEQTPDASTPAPTSTPDPASSSSSTPAAASPPASEPEKDWQAEAEKWRTLARKHEDRRKVDGWLSPDDAKALAEERDSLRTATADVDSLKLDAAQELAVARLQTRLARSGLSDEDVEALSSAVDPSRLLAEGAPSSEAIGKIATALTRRAGVSTPDPDQGAGRGSGPAAPSMSDLMRAGAGRGAS